MKQKTIRQLLSRLMILAMVALLAVAVSPAVRAADWTVADAAELEAAIIAANAAGAGEHAITLTADITLDAPLTPLGNSEATRITLDGGGFTLDAAGVGTALVVGKYTTVTIADITITGGIGSSLADGLSGGGIANQGYLTVIDSIITKNNAQNGGGIANYGDALISPTLTLQNVALSDNEATAFGGGLYNLSNEGVAETTITGSTFDDNRALNGGGIANHGLGDRAIVNMVDSTVLDNEALNGGGFFNNGNAGEATIHLAGVTIVSNSATVSGGGIYNNGNLGTAAVSLVNSALSANEAAYQGGGILNSPNDGVAEVALTFSTVAGNAANLGGGVANLAGGTVELAATILNQGERGYSCFAAEGAPITSSGYNLDDDDSCGLTEAGDIPGGEAALAPLALNAPGQTATQAIGDDSDALNQVPTGVLGCGTDVATDQRGAPRPAPEPLCDIGAYESDFGSLVCTPPYQPAAETELNDAIACVNAAGAGDHAITLAGDITLSAATTPLNNAQAGEILLDGDGHVLNGGLSGTALAIEPGTTVRVVDITITGGRGTSGPTNDWGGGIYNRGALTVRNSTITGNTAGRGAGIVNFGDGMDAKLDITGSTLSGNTATGAGGGILNTSGDGGKATLTVTNSTLSGNDAGAGGGLFNESAGDGATAGETTATFAFVTLANNAAASGGRGIHVVASEGVLPEGEAQSRFAAAGRATTAIVNLTATIIAGGGGGDACAAEAGLIASLGYNLAADDSCALTQDSDLPSADAGLLPLALNAPGQTATHALGARSEAYDRVPMGQAGCGTTITTDQRGQTRPRPAGGQCDAGAFEAAPRQYTTWLPAVVGTPPQR